MVYVGSKDSWEFHLQEAILYFLKARSLHVQQYILEHSCDPTEAQLYKFHLGRPHFTAFAPVRDQG